MLGKNYFKGWYFKCCTGDNTIAFIPAYHKTGGKTTYSLQIITDEGAFFVPFDEWNYSEKPLRIEIGSCVFSRNGIVLNVENAQIRGKLRFSAMSPVKYDIMGPFAHLPFMQCRHSVFSLRHRIDGQLVLNGRQYDFQNGVGYIEGDCGYSFPDRYIWTQCCFESGSLMLAVADIPVAGLRFTGIIGAVLRNGEEKRIATYLGARVVKIGESSIAVQQGKYILLAELLKRNAYSLKAPVNGSMSRTIYESASCKAHYRLMDRDTVLLDMTSDRASFEFEYPHS